VTTAGPASASRAMRSSASAGTASSRGSSGASGRGSALDQPQSPSWDRGARAAQRNCEFFCQLLCGFNCLVIFFFPDLV
jgi:hypothetical protein